MHPELWLKTRTRKTEGVSLSANQYFASCLLSGNDAHGTAEQDGLFDPMPGCWDITAIDYLEDGSTQEIKEEWIFSRVLEGRAIQDAWIAPKRKERTLRAPGEHNRYGSSLRMYDAVQKTWLVSWFNPLNGEADRLVARKSDDDIVQEGQSAVGIPIRWCFRDIKPDSFHWTGERSTDGGKTWQMESAFFATRAS